METIKSLLADYWKNILIIILMFMIFSCGTRNTKKTEVKEEIKTEIEASTNTEVSEISETKTETKTDNDVVDQSENLTPIDPSKPMTKTVEEKDGKKITTYENANVSSGTKTDKSKKAETKNEIAKIDSKSKSDFKAVQEVKKSDMAKVTESNKGFSFSLWWLLLLLIPVGIWKFYNIKNKVL